MKLNNYSYAHIKVRKLCQLLEYYTDMNLITDLSEDFDEIKLMNKLSYLRIDFRNNVCFAMSHKLTKKEMDIIDEIQVTLNFMEIVGYWQSQINSLNL